MKLKSIVEWVRAWRERRVWLRYQEYEAQRLAMRILEFEAWQLRQLRKHQKERERILKRVNDSEGKDDYVS